MLALGEHPVDGRLVDLNRAVVVTGVSGRAAIATAAATARRTCAVPALALAAPVVTPARDVLTVIGVARPLAGALAPVLGAEEFVSQASVWLGAFLPGLLRKGGRVVWPRR